MRPPPAALALGLLLMAPRLASCGEDLSLLLQRAADYVAGYEKQFSQLVAHESYRQTSCGEQRRLESDVVFVRLPGEIPWAVFRDVFSVDGRAIRDRQSRLESLFINGPESAFERARQIVAESARFNLGRTERNFNIPTLALLFLTPRNQARFAFQLGERRKLAGVVVTGVRYEERARPTLIHDRRDDSDIPAAGVLWIDGAGAVRETELRITYHEGSALLRTSYRVHAALGLLVPDEMREEYSSGGGEVATSLGGTGNSAFAGSATLRVTPCGDSGDARYTDFRRFEVKTEETFSVP